MVSKEEQVRAEAELARQLVDAPASDRAKLYGIVYDRIYEMHLSRDPEALDFGATPRLVRFLEMLAAPGADVIEVGCGGGLLAIELAQRNRQVLGVDVSQRILEVASKRAGQLPSLRFLSTAGTAIPAEGRAADLVYSVEVLDHLHPDDVATHLREVHRVLKPGGRYWLLAPNRHDSRGSARRFGVDIEVNADVHLKNWTYSELAPELERAGFCHLRSPWRNTRLLSLPLLPVSWFVQAERLPAAVLSDRRARSLLGIIACSIVACKR
jgi:2-polyprenyl-3-methyl-5-hydroxy-6-metoxy-1,4-benzoquinol methylase